MCLTSRRRPRCQGAKVVGHFLRIICKMPYLEHTVPPFRVERSSRFKVGIRSRMTVFNAAQMARRTTSAYSTALDEELTRGQLVTSGVVNSSIIATTPHCKMID